MLFLAADIGGTRSRLLLGRWKTDNSWQTVRQAEFPSRDYASASILLASFLQPDEQPAVACLALAGPVADNRCKLTNLPWDVDSETLCQQVGLNHVLLLNDFVAQAHGLSVLKTGQRIVLQEGQPQPDATRALIGAGTGLGMAVVHQNSVYPSEGGHADFAATDERQAALCDWMREMYGRASLESVLSGKGIERIHVFFGGAPAGAAYISNAAARREPQAMFTLSLFAQIYASVAGNLALTHMAFGGVYLGGGIAPRILPFLRDPKTVEAFRNKPPMRALLEKIPLYVVMDDYLGLRGAAEVAARLTRQEDYTL